MLLWLLIVPEREEAVAEIMGIFSSKICSYFFKKDLNVLIAAITSVFETDRKRMAVEKLTLLKHEKPLIILVELILSVKRNFPSRGFCSGESEMNDYNLSTFPQFN